MDSRFDLVHQRLVLSNVAEPGAAIASLRRLIGLVKPGGWIQIDEAKALTGPLEPSDTPIDTFWKALGSIILAFGMDPTPSDRTVALLEEAGKGLLGPIHSKVARVKLGNGAPSREVALAGVANVMGILDAMKPNVAQIPKSLMSAADFESLRPKCLEQLSTVGDDTEYVGAWAQRLT